MGGVASIATMVTEIDDFMLRCGKVDPPPKTTAIPSTDGEILVVQSYGQGPNGKMWLARIYASEGCEKFVLIHSIGSAEDLICGVIPFLAELQIVS